jgi:streptomycin 6-kinase
MTQITIPDALARSALNWGPNGAAWLDSLQARVDALIERWHLRVVDPEAAAGACSLVLRVVGSDGSSRMLKVQWPHEEAEHEADALRAYDGDGAVLLLDADVDHNALLIERCEPGAAAWQADDVVGVCASVMTRLWRPVADDAPFDRRALAGERAERIRRRFVEFGRPFDESLMSAGADMFDELAASAPSTVLLHGDLHPDNVLRAQREPWLAIDPKPLVGDPAFDTAQLVLNLFGRWPGVPKTSRDWPMPVTMRTIADAVGLDIERVWGWTFARTVEEITWSLADGQPIDRDVEIARYFASLRP